MKSLFAFIKKEIMEQFRSGRLVILGILFILLGIMNPFFAKLMPWLLEILVDSNPESGMTITVSSVSAMDSWVQFFKNIPIGLLAFVLFQSNIFTKEYQSGTLVLSLTKGLERFKVVISKMVVLIGFWTIGYWISFLITYGYNAYFWNNSVACNLIFSVVCCWVFGVLVISLMLLFSTISNSNTTVLVGTAAIVLVSYLLGWLPKIDKYLPTVLTNGNSLIYGVVEAKSYVISLIISLVTCLICFIASIQLFNKKQL